MKKYIPQFLLMVLLVLGALGQTGTPYLLVQLVAIAALAGLALRQGRAEAPPGFFLYLLFLAILVWKYLQSPYQSDLDYLYLFAGGGVLWFAGFNLRDKLAKPLGRLIIALGLLMGAFYLVFLVRGSAPIIPGSLFASSSAFKNHNHIGDLWAVVLLLGLDRLMAKKSASLWGLLGLGLYFLLASYSRSALIAFVVGISYLFSGNNRKISRYLFGFFILAALVIFFLTSSGKTIFFSRPYFSQAVWGLIHHPEGVGMGNFKAVSSRFEIGTYSSIVHNIILEILAGVGWWGLPFVVWLGVTLRRILRQEGPPKIYRAVFLTLCLNFMFDSTYAIPTLVWIWFLSLGLSYGRRNRGLYRLPKV